MKLSKIKLNPDNPRVIKDDKFLKLVNSIINFPQMLEKRRLVCVTDTDKKIFPLGGNMRYKALIEISTMGREAVLNYLQKFGKEENINLLEPLFKGEIPDSWIELADEWTEEQRKEFIIKDNVSFGEWDFDELANKWDTDKLNEWNMDISAFGSSGNDWKVNYKELPQNGDQLVEKLGFAPHSMWYSYPRIVDGISEKMIALPKRKNSNPHQDKYSRTTVEEIRRIILTYMRDGDFFLENCCGWSTFGGIAAIHGYKGIGVDIWDVAIEYSRKQIQNVNGDVLIMEADGMNLPFEDNKFDYVYCNPPFMDVELYSEKENDIAGKNENDFINNFDRLMLENYRVLKKGKLCTITISDTRKNGVIKSLLYIVLNSAFKASFKLHDMVIVEVLGVANIYRKKAFENKRMPKNHEYVITFIK